MSVEMPSAEEQAEMDAQKQADAEAVERASMMAQPKQHPQRQTPLVVRPPWHTRILQFLKVVTGPKVSGVIWRKRVRVCANCSEHEEVQYKYDVRMYCGMCGCPRWRFSELKKANQYELFTCNLGRHPGQNNAPGGCSGCGG